MADRPARRRRAERPGTEAGTAVPISTTERRWARPRMTHARSTRSPRHGRCSPAPPTRHALAEAMKAVDEQLVRHEERLILLFTPPFDDSSLDPGYVKGYLPGVRENGGQYTHAAVWVVQAAALLGQGQLACAAVANPQPDPPRPRPGRGRALPGRALRRWPETCTAALRMRVAEAGLGTPARRAGIIRPFSNRSSVFTALGDRINFQPCIPPEWSRFEITYRFRSATYAITVENPNWSGIRRRGCLAR